MRACQWSGVAIITASISLSSSTRRKSSSKPGLSPCALAISAPVFSSTLGSRSQKVLNRAPAWTARSASPLPWLRPPIRARVTFSLAPIAAGFRFTKAAAAAALLRKALRSCTRPAYHAYSAAMRLPAGPADHGDYLIHRLTDVAKRIDLPIGTVIGGIAHQQAQHRIRRLRIADTDAASRDESIAAVERLVGQFGVNPSFGRFQQRYRRHLQTAGRSRYQKLHPKTLQLTEHTRSRIRNAIEDGVGGWGGMWDLNPRLPEPQSGALPTELIPPQGTPS